MAQVRLPASDGIATYRCHEPIDFNYAELIEGGEVGY